MGISTGGSQGGVKNDINVTPLVDIVLVLLIIFLVITPIKMRSLTIEVPRKLDQNEDTSVASKQITVLVRADNSIKIQNGPESIELTNRFELAKTLRPLIEARRTEKVVFVDFEDPVLYGETVSTMDTIKSVGAEKVALKIRDDDQAGAQ
jgi:biopolymer transport protein TolR